MKRYSSLLIAVLPDAAVEVAEWVLGQWDYLPAWLEAALVFVELLFGSWGRI